MVSAPQFNIYPGMNNLEPQYHNPAMQSASYYRDQILANCRWLFSQDVQLITAYEPHLSEVFVIPTTSSLRSVSELNRHKDVLIYIALDDGDGDPLREMLTKTEGLIRGVYSAEKQKYDIKTAKVLPGRRNTAVHPAETQSPEIRLESAIRSLVDKIDILVSRTAESTGRGMETSRSLERILKKMDHTLDAIQKRIERYPDHDTTSRTSASSSASQIGGDNTPPVARTTTLLVEETDYETSECETVMTPTMSERGVAIERELIREEIDRALSGAMVRMAQLLSRGGKMGE